MREHPASKLLERFMRGEASAIERRSIVRHMLTGCPQCLEVTRPLWRFGDLPLIPPEGDPEQGDPEQEELGEDEEDEGDGKDRAPAVEACGAGSRLAR